MKKHYKTKRLITMLVLVAVIVAGFGVMNIGPENVYAAGDDAKILVSQYFTEDPANGADVEYSLTVIYGLLPNGNNSGEYRFTLDGLAVEDYPIVIPGLAPGEYEYSLKAIPDSRENYEFDPVVYKIKIYVTATAYDILIYNENNDKVAAAEFYHSYGECDPFVAVDPPVRKDITGRGTPPSDAEFRFRLKARDPGNPMPPGSTGDEKIMSIYGTGVEDFGVWEYRQPGTYVYDISEVNMRNPDYEYDRRMYTITDVVTRSSNQLFVERTIVDSTGRVVESTLTSGVGEPWTADFINEYVGDGGSGGSGTGTGTGGSNVQTGDTARPYMWMEIGLGAALVFFIILIVRRRRKEQE